MKSPIRDARFRHASISYLKSIVPIGSHVDAYGLFSATTELSLSSCGRKVNAFTTQSIISNFWKCLCEDPIHIRELLHDKAFHFGGAAEYVTLQERFMEYAQEPYYAAALFFILNRHSQTGKISTGEYSPRFFTPSAIHALSSFKKPQLFDVDECDNFETTLKERQKPNNVSLFPCMAFSYNLFDEGKAQSYDTYRYDHNILRENLKNQDHKLILVYRRHPGVISFYKDYNIQLVDKYGKICYNATEYEEAIVTNF